MVDTPRNPLGSCGTAGSVKVPAVSIPQTFIQELLTRADVVDVVGRYVQLKKGGANFMGLCPFHGEKSPSFSVSPSKQFYHCFGCGANGNAITFLMEHAGMNFVEAVKDLAQQCGLPVPEEDASPEDRARAAAQRQRQATLTDVLEKAGDAYRRHLKSSHRAVDYFKGRGVSGEVARRYGLGYAPEGWRSLASVFSDYDDSLLSESGLVIAQVDETTGEEKRYDRFRDRVMFPIRNVKGECIGFGGRVLGDDKPKYLNSPETPVFSKGRELYGLFEARAALREHAYALVTEGYMDVVALAQLGFPNVVATLGTACTADHVHKLFRYTDAVVFSFDGDSAGQRAAHKALDAAVPYATDTRSIKFLFLPAEHDPDSFVRTFGADAFSRHVQGAMPLSRFLVESASEGCDLGTAEGRAHMASKARPLWSALPEGALKLQLLAELAELVQLGTHELKTLWSAAAPGYASGGGGGTSGYAGASGPGSNRSASAYDSASEYIGGGGGSYSPNMDGSSPTNRYKKNSYKGNKNGGTWEKTYDNYTPPRRGRTQGVSRADHAARLLLSHMDFLETLSHEDHSLLCELPVPHGPLFIWLEASFHEHGVQAWAVLRGALQGHECEPLALEVMTGSHAQTEGETRELHAELRDLLNRILIERLKQQETEAIGQAASDPLALQRYRLLQNRRLALELLRPSADA